MTIINAMGYLVVLTLTLFLTTDSMAEWSSFTHYDSDEKYVKIERISDTQNELIIAYHIPGMEITKHYHNNKLFRRLNIFGAGHFGEVGKAELPMITRYIEAKPHQQVEKTEILSYRLANYYLFTIYPNQDVHWDEPQRYCPAFIISKDFYQQNSFHPTNIVQLEKAIDVSGIKVRRLRLNPIQYNPASARLKVYYELRIKITFKNILNRATDSDVANKGETKGNNKHFFRQLTLNGGDDSLTDPTESSDTESTHRSLLIITHTSFSSAASHFSRWKNQKGIKTTIKAFNTGVTSSDISTYIKELYKSQPNPFTDILIIGDAEFIPTNYVNIHPLHGQKTGTDLYYATLSGDDFYPDVGIGRISVDTAYQAYNQLNKIIRYEKNPPRNKEFYQNATLVAFFQHDNNGYAARRFTQTAEDIAIFLTDHQYLGKYTADRIYLADSQVRPQYWSKRWFGGGPSGNPGDPIPDYLLRTSGYPWTGDANHISRLINRGTSLIFHRNHGFSQSWKHPHFTVNDVAGLKNGKLLPVLLSINCETGWFDNETDHLNNNNNHINFSEAWERNPEGGAVGILASTRASISGYNDRMAWGIMDALWPSFRTDYPGVGQNSALQTMGDVLNYMKFYMANYYAADDEKVRLGFELFHWFGDPTMQLWTEEPKDLSIGRVSFNSARSLRIDLSRYQGALITASQKGAILSSKFASSTTTILRWPTRLAIGEKLDIVITKHNYRPYIKTIRY